MRVPFTVYDIPAGGSYHAAVLFQVCSTPEEVKTVMQEIQGITISLHSSPLRYPVYGEARNQRGFLSRIVRNVILLRLMSRENSFAFNSQQQCTENK